MGAMASQITSLIIVYSTVYSGADQRKHQRSASLAFVRGIPRWPVNSPHKWPVTRKMFDDVTMRMVCTVYLKNYAHGLCLLCFVVIWYWSPTAIPFTLPWRHNDHDGVSNHQPHGCLLNRLFRRRSKKTPKICVTGLLGERQEAQILTFNAPPYTLSL